MSGEAPVGKERPLPDGPQITLVTVVIEKHYPYIQDQLDLIDALNPGAPFKLLVVDNAASATGGLSSADPRVRLVAGFDPAPLPLEGRGSYHHALALNKAARLVDTRYMLVMDPDFFVIRPGWIDACISHVEARGLSFFGAPWHYLSYRKWRYFPCVHFLLIDLDKVSAAELDFTPAIVEDRRWLNSAAARWLKKYLPRLYNRSLVESRRDTGWRLRRLRGRRASEVLQPVLSIERELRAPKHLRHERGRSFERLLPRRWSYLPAPGSYVEPEVAPEFQRGEFEQLRPEMFAWRGEAFAFHMRRNMRDKTKGRTDDDTRKDEAALGGLLARVRAGGRLG